MVKAIVYICLIIFVIFVVVETIRRTIANRITSQLICYLYDEKTSEFDTLINSTKARLSIFPYYRDNLKLSAAIIRNDEKEINKIMESFEKANLKVSQREALYLQCFQYYVLKENSTEATKYYNLIKENNPEGDHTELEISYDVFVQKGSKYLEQCLNRLDELEGNEKKAYESYLYQMYKNKGDKENTEIFYKLLNDQEKA